METDIDVYFCNPQSPWQTGSNENTNRLLRNKRWDIQVSKTGYINEAGRCLVMHTEFNGTPTVLILLNSYGKLTPFGDANRVRKWIETGADRHQRKSASNDSKNPAETG